MNRVRPAHQPPQPYPAGRAARDRFITSRRAARPAHDPWRPLGVSVEDEPTEAGIVTRVATVFLTGRECPWRCAMCDLWQYTTESDTPAGAIAAQVDAGVRDLAHDNGTITRIKLYNAGSFFDPRAVPPGDYDAVASATRQFTRVTVESHPSLVGARTILLREALDRARDPRGTMTAGTAPGQSPTLEVAMGLETAHPAALDRLNKGMSLDDFRRAAMRLAEMGVALRVFLLISPPFVDSGEQDDWLATSIDTAFGCGATAVSLIPVRAGNGTMEALAAAGDFLPPHLTDVERSLAMALARPRPAGARVFADLWDLARFATCPHCLASRHARLMTMNLEQRERPAVVCRHCEGGRQ